MVAQVSGHRSAQSLRSDERSDDLAGSVDGI